MNWLEHYWKWIALGLGLILLSVAVSFLPVAQWVKAFTDWVRHLGLAGAFIFIGVYALAAVLFLPGAIFTIAIWILLGFAFRWYVNAFAKETYNRTYGTVGGVAVLLLFFYLDALVLMIGAEINSEIDYEILGVERGCRDFTAPPQPMFVEQSQPTPR